MKQTITTTLIILLAVTATAWGRQTPEHFDLNAAGDPGGRLSSNSIIDIAAQKDNLWFGTGQGLAQLHNDSSWSNFGQANGIGEGGVSALYVSDSIIWVATAYTEKVDLTYYPAGGGVGYSRDNGVTWHWEAQPIDSRTETRYSPTTTNIQNVTYDITVSDSAVWLSSWGGGLRRKLHSSTVWEVVTPDEQPFSALDNLNHRAFSTTYCRGTLWVGTAAGVCRSNNEGQSWTKYSHLDDDTNSLSGNFVTAMAAQLIDSVRYNLWVAGWKAQTVSEYYGVCRFDGNSWSVSLSDSTVLSTGEYLVDVYGPLRVHNFGFQGQKVWAAADGVLWWHPNEGIVTGPGHQEWKRIEPGDVYDPTINERFGDADFFSVAGVGDSVWVGSDDGLAVGFRDNLGNLGWRIHRAYQTPGQGGEPETYAYPSPFSPNRGHQTRFQFPVKGVSSVSLKIMNFGMELVFERSGVPVGGGGTGDMAGYGNILWNGGDRFGNIVANGVYFYQIKVGGETYWGKVMVID